MAHHLAAPLLVCAACVGCNGSETTDASGAGGQAGAPGVWPCAQGEVPRADGSCRAPGVPDGGCGAGFASDGMGGCDPLLPPACLPGELAIPGDSACSELGPCGAPPWGDIPVEGNTQFVDRNYSGGNSDGGPTAPWTTIAEGILAAESGAIVAVAAGSYPENLNIDDKPVRLWGRCAALVELAGPAAGFAALSVTTSGTELHDLAVTSARVGIGSSGADPFVVDGVWIHDTGGRGLNVEDTLGPSTVIVRRTVIEAATEAGAMALGASLTLEQSLVRGIRPAAGFQTQGVTAQTNLATGDTASLTMRSSVVEDNVELGVSVIGSDATIEACVVRGTLATPLGERGIGVLVQDDVARVASLVLHTSVIEQSRLAGVFVSGSHTTLERTVVRDIHSEESTGLFGRGLSAEPHPVSGARPEIVILDSLVASSREAAIAVFGGHLELSGVRVRDTSPRELDQLYGRAVNAQHVPALPNPRSSLSMSETLVEAAHDFGVFLTHSDATLERVVVTGTLPLGDGRYGDGVLGIEQATLFVTDSRIAESARAGLSTFGSNAGVKGTHFECNPIDLDAEAFNGPNELNDEGGNVCGCAGESRGCVARSAQLEPPSAL